MMVAARATVRTMRSRDVALRDPDRAGARRGRDGGRRPRGAAARGVRRPTRTRACRPRGRWVLTTCGGCGSRSALRGYRMSEVDALLDRLASEREQLTQADRAEPEQAGVPDPARGDGPPGRGHSHHVDRGRHRLRPDRAGRCGDRADPAASRARGRGACTRRVDLLTVHTVAGDARAVHLAGLPGRRRGRHGRQRGGRHRGAGLLVDNRDRGPADPGALAAQPRQARLATVSGDSWCGGRGSRCSPTSACWSPSASSPGPTCTRTSERTPTR